jgi:hypothetical protein
MNTTRALMAGLALSTLLSGCCVDADGERHWPGQSYTCTDGCNTCKCHIFGESHTQMLCLERTGEDSGGGDDTDDSGEE